MVSIFTRTIIIYFLLLLSLKLMGKRQIGELEINELVSTLLISEIASMPITEPDIPFFNAIIPIIFIVTSEILLSFLKNKSNNIKKLIEGEPSYIIYKGRIRQNVLLENRISMNELLCEMRLQSIFDISNVAYAILEQNGNISFLKRSQNENLMHSVIIDGGYNEEKLSSLGYNESWLMGELRKHRARLRETFYLGVYDSGETYFVKKEKK